MSQQHTTYLFTSESVSEGHPDKVADRLSDTILDHVLGLDPSAKVACEALVAKDLVIIAGEFRVSPPGLFTQIEEAVPGIVRQTLSRIGYDGSFPGIDPENCEIRVQLNQQSPDIHRGVEREDRVLGAGDQGLMFGYATDETPERIPLPLLLAHRLMARQAKLRRQGELPWLRPDAKSQVTVRYQDEEPVTVETVVLSTQHAEGVSSVAFEEAVRELIVNPVIPIALRSEDYRVLVNPTGRFTIGGPEGDTGLTGRKIIVDSYGGRCPHGGGAFSGKDPTKVDRSAAYMARYVANNIVAAGLARRCTIQLAYAIGVAEPVSIHIDLHATGQVEEARLEAAIPKVFDLTPAGIIRTLDLCRPLYAQTAAYGHFGRDDIDLSWEKIDRVTALLGALGVQPKKPGKEDE